MELAEGSRIHYIGPEIEGLVIGDQAQVLASGATASHVVFRTGSLLNQIRLIVNSDLVPRSSSQDWDEAVYETPLVTISVQSTYDARGAKGLVNSLDADGHLSSIGTLAEDAIDFVARRLREEPSVREVMSQLDQDDSEDFLHYVSVRVFQEALADGE